MYKSLQKLEKKLVRLTLNFCKYALKLQKYFLTILNLLRQEYIQRFYLCCQCYNYSKDGDKARKPCQQRCAENSFRTGLSVRCIITVFLICLVASPLTALSQHTKIHSESLNVVCIFLYIMRYGIRPLNNKTALKRNILFMKLLRLHSSLSN